MDNTTRDNRFDETNRENRDNRYDNYNNNRSRNTIWPWIAGIVVIGLIAILVFSNNDRDDRQETAYNSELNSDYRGSGSVTATDNTQNQDLEYADERNRDLGNNSTINNSRDINNQSGQSDRQSGQSDRASNKNINNPAVASYVEFVESGVRNNDDIDTRKVGQAFRHLAEATDAKASELGVRPSVNLRVARENIDQINSGSTANVPGESIRQTAEILSNELANLQKSKYPDLDNKASQLQKASQSIDPDEQVMDQKGEIKDFFTEAADLLEEMEFETDDR